MEFTLNNRAVPNGTVLVLGITYANQTSDKVWTYVALKIGGLWYLTGNGQVPTAAGWAAVERWLGKQGRQVVWVKAATGWFDLYPLTVELAGRKFDLPASPAVTVDDFPGVE